MKENNVEKWRLRDVIYGYIFLNILVFLGMTIEGFLANSIKLPLQLNDNEQYCLHRFVEVILTLFPIWFLIKKYPIIKLKDLTFFNKKKAPLFLGGLACYIIIATIGFLNIYSKPVSNLMIIINYEGFYRILFLANLLIFAPLIEEIFFRGLIFTILKNRINIFWGIIITSILFSIGHENWIDAFFRSIILTYVYGKSYCLSFSILTHIFMNMIAISSAFIIFFYF